MIQNESILFKMFQNDSKWFKVKPYYFWTKYWVLEQCAECCHTISSSADDINLVKHLIKEIIYCLILLRLCVLIGHDISLAIGNSKKSSTKESRKMFRRQDTPRILDSPPAPPPGLRLKALKSKGSSMENKYMMPPSISIGKKFKMIQINSKIFQYEWNCTKIKKSFNLLAFKLRPWIGNIAKDWLKDGFLSVVLKIRFRMIWNDSEWFEMIRIDLKWFRMIWNGN